MKDPSVIFWTVLVFVSMAWYGFLVFYLGFKGGRDMRTLIRTLKAKTKR